MTPIEELELILNLIRKYELPLSPILEYAVNEKKEQFQGKKSIDLAPAVSQTETSTSSSSKPTPQCKDKQKIESAVLKSESTIRQKRTHIQSQESHSIELTYELIESARNSNGTFTKSQLAAVGVGWPPPMGWIHKIVGKKITDSQFEQFKPVDKSDPKNDSSESLLNDSRVNSTDVEITNQFDLERMQVILATMSRFSFPATAQDIAWSISRSAWGGSVKVQEVLSLLRQMPEVERLGKDHYFLKGK